MKLRTALLSLVFAVSACDVEVFETELSMFVIVPSTSIEKLAASFESYASEMGFPQQYDDLADSHLFAQQRFMRPGWHAIAFWKQPPIEGMSPNATRIRVNFLAFDASADLDEYLYPDARKLIHHLREYWGDDIVIDVNYGDATKVLSQID